VKVGEQDVGNTIGVPEVAALLTVAGATVYVLGLIGLAMPIKGAFTRDISTAWYAVSLVPKTVVMGQGARIWLRWPFILLVLGLPVKLLLPPSLLSDAVILGVALVVALKVVFGEYASRGKSVIAVFLAASTLAIVATAPNIFVATLGLFMGGFLLGVPEAINAAPPLPEIEVNLNKQHGNTKDGPPTCVFGQLVAHSDGFWYLFDKNSKELLSIPDGDVLDTRIPPS
jgi:hypothetical protein